MNEKKDFRLYAQKRVGFPPRSILQNTFPRILADLQPPPRNFRVVEFGFSHGNDARYMIGTLQNVSGIQNWEYWGFDHEDYFCPQFLLDGCGKDIRKKIHLVPCLFERIASGRQAFPDKIDLFYASKSLSLCDKDLFPDLLHVICAHISPGGSFVGTFHLNGASQNHFWTIQDYLRMFFSEANGAGPVFKGFSTEYAVHEQRQTFACFSKKTGNTSIKRAAEIIADRSDHAYAEASHGE